MKAPTKTQLQIAQELERRGCQQMVTTQDEYLKFARPGNRTIWVGRHGELREGRRLPSSIGCCGKDWQALKREAKANYKGE